MQIILAKASLDTKCCEVVGSKEAVVHMFCMIKYSLFTINRFKPKCELIGESKMILYHINPNINDYTFPLYVVLEA